MTHRLVLIPSFLFACAMLFAEIPDITRRISHQEAGPNSIIRITIQVTLPENNTDIPNAWILEESWPDDCKIQNPIWNGTAYPAIPRENDDCWIFGYPDTPWEVSAGTLTYDLILPDLKYQEKNRRIEAYGKVYTFDDDGAVRGDGHIVLDKDAPHVENLPIDLTINPGWNLISMPYPISEEQRDTLFPRGNFYGCATTTSPDEMAFLQNAFPNTPGTPFWYHDDGEIPRLVELTASEPVADALLPNGGEWHDGWNLVGVQGTTPQEVTSKQGLWIWQNGNYHRSISNTLLPGQAGWIFR